MRIDFVLKRVGMVLILVWVAATLNFIGPRLTGKDPVKTRLLKQAAIGGYVQQGMDEMAKEYERKFGLDKPLWDQYVTYVTDMSRFNFGPSISNYPRTVNEILSDDFLCSMPDGTLLDRKAFLEQTARPVTITNLQAYDVKIRLMGDFAIIHAATSYTAVDGTTSGGRYTDVWARRNGQWLAVSAHVTRR